MDGVFFCAATRLDVLGDGEKRAAAHYEKAAEYFFFDFFVFHKFP
jgi:hypothetical protein